MSEPAEMIKPEEFKVTGPDGKELTYILSNFNAVDGRRIATQYPTTALPKIGDYEANEKLYFLIMSHVAAIVDGKPLRLVTPALVVNHVPDFEVSMKIEAAMISRNFSFFRDGRSLDFFERAAQMFMERLSEILTRSSASSSPAEKQPSGN